MTKIDIISGFLGAGKTTFIRKLLKEAIAGEQVVLIENEFGEIGIDGDFLKGEGVEIREMNSGCICCSLAGDFGKSLEEVLTRYCPDRVIIEPSGVGKLSDVIKAVREVSGRLDVQQNSAVTIVDASKCKMYMKNFGEFFNNQIEHAKTIVLSRTDVTDEAKVRKCVEMIREHNESAAIITTPCSQLSGSQLLEIMEKQDTMEMNLMKEIKNHDYGHHQKDGGGCGCHSHEHHQEDGCGCGCHDHEHHQEESCGCHNHHHDHDHHHHHHAEEVFSSWGMEMIHSFRKEELEAILEELANGNAYGDVLRAKGMLPGTDQEEWFYFDLVPDEYEIRTGRPDYTGKVCVIGARLKEDALNKAFGRS